MNGKSRNNAPERIKAMNSSKLLPKRWGYTIFGVIGFLFIFFWKTGKNLAEWGNILWTAQYTWSTLGVSLVLGAALGGGCAFLCYASAAHQNPKSRSAQTRKKASGSGKGQGIVGSWTKISHWVNSLSGTKVFGFSLLLILISWLPVFLAYYPGICAYDSPIQTGQAYEGYYIDHHPIVHTMLIKAAMQLGSKVLGNSNGGIAIYTLLQMLLLAGGMSYGLAILRRFQVKAGWLIAVLFLCMCYPFHWYMSVSMTKDTVFSAFLLIQLVSLAVLLLEDRRTLKWGRTDVIFLISTVGMILFRNNGKYAMLVPLVFLVLMVWRGKKARRLWGRLLLTGGTAFLMGNLILSAVFSATNAQQGDRREMLSMPIQQLSRCMVYHGGVGVEPADDNTLEDAERALINDFLLNEAYKSYNPAISDPVKAHTNTYVVRYRIKDFAKIYLQLLAKYPGDFMNAALAVNAGFLYPGDVSHAYINVSEGAKNMGYVQTHWEEETLNARGIYKASKWPWLFERLEQWADGNAYLDVPVLKYFFVPGSFLWFYLLLLGYLLVRRRFRLCLPISLVAGYYLTMFLGPTVQLRYLYPVMIVLPFLVLLGMRAVAVAEDN